MDVPLLLTPDETQQIPLYAQLEPSILQIDSPLEVTAEVSLSFDLDEQRVSLEKTQDITIYGQGALRWDNVSRAAAFITTADEKVAAFARQSLVAFEDEIKARGRPLANLTRAMVLFEALKAHGLRYLAEK